MAESWSSLYRAIHMIVETGRGDAVHFYRFLAKFGATFDHVRESLLQRAAPMRQQSVWRIEAGRS